VNSCPQRLDLDQMSGFLHVDIIEMKVAILDCHGEEA
jgi:hypothetical protein